MNRMSSLALAFPQPQWKKKQLAPVLRVLLSERTQISERTQKTTERRLSSQTDRNSRYADTETVLAFLSKRMNTLASLRANPSLEKVAVEAANKAKSDSEIAFHSPQPEFDQEKTKANHLFVASSNDLAAFLPQTTSSLHNNPLFVISFP